MWSWAITCYDQMLLVLRNVVGKVMEPHIFMLRDLLDSDRQEFSRLVERVARTDPLEDIQNRVPFVDEPVMNQI